MYSDRKPIWKIDRHFKCPVIGACLSVQELKKILKKTGICIKYLNPYQVQKHNKPVQMLPNASLSAISQVLIEIIGTN
ncbi:MAG: hypothetical protein KAU38_07120 [Desulfobacterales bacterium]|nr:hypothetical protein [Desulfobacterales bacterium]